MSSVDMRPQKKRMYGNRTSAISEAVQAISEAVQAISEAVQAISISFRITRDRNETVKTTKYHVTHITGDPGKKIITLNHKRTIP